MQRRSDSCGSDEASPGEESGELAADRRLQWIENSLHAGSTRFDDIHCLINLSAFLIIAIFHSQTWRPLNNKKFETLSYLPPLSEESIAKEIDYMIGKGWVPSLEFDEVICTAIIPLSGGFSICMVRLSVEGRARAQVQQPDSGVLRREVLDDVEAAHVRLHRRFAGAGGDPRVQSGLSRRLRPTSGFRQQAAVPVHLLRHPEAPVIL